MTKKAISILLILLAYPGKDALYGQFKSYYVPSATVFIDGNQSPFQNVQPGDTLFLEAGHKDMLMIRNIAGSADYPVIIMNKGGIVSLSSEGYYGISIQNCRYFRLSGQGDLNHFYGIQILKVSAGAGVGIGERSTDFEIDHIWIQDCSIAGIYAKTEPDCSLKATRGNFTQFNTRIHDNYIYNAGNEGIYTGSSNYGGVVINCNGKDTLVLPSLLIGTRIYNNIIKQSGWDGIQVSSASSDCQVYNNMILNDSQAGVDGQMSGILLGGGSKCDCFNNLISGGKGDGIESHGLGGYKIYNNIIIDAGRSFMPSDHTRMKHGIFVTDVSSTPDSSFYILFNDIINPKTDGIRFTSKLSRNNLIASNLIINPGSYTGNLKEMMGGIGENSYINVTDTSIDIDLADNFMARNFESAFISADNFLPFEKSPLIDGALSDSTGIILDFYHHSRPYGPFADIGAVEYNPVYPGPKPDGNEGLTILPAYPVPVRSVLNIRYRSGQSEDTLILVYNLIGELILTQKVTSIKGKEQQVQIDASNLPAGIYIYFLNNSLGSKSGKFIKVDF